MKRLFIAEKPSVAQEFAKALDMPLTRSNGCYEDDNNIVTWCVGHLIAMSYPEKYDPELKKWSLDTIPFIPDRYKYETIPAVYDQYKVVKTLLNRSDVDAIYYSGDSAREGEYIQRLIRQEAGHNPNAKEYRVWIDSQTRDEILKGINTAHELSYYNTLSDSAYARAIEDFLAGINFSRAMTLKYGRILSNATGNRDNYTIAVGRVMSCVLGMVVAREREIRSTTVIPFYSVRATMQDQTEADWKIMPDSPYKNIPENYEDKGLLKQEMAQDLVNKLNANGTLNVLDKKQSVKNQAAPLLFNLAELQNECTKRFHISPAETLECAQALYDAKLTTYPRTDARVLSTAISKEITKNINGLSQRSEFAPFVSEINQNNWHANLLDPHCKYVDDSKIADHYAIIPTGEGFAQYNGLNEMCKKVYDLICRRFLAIFYPEAVYDKLQVTYKGLTETFIANYTALKEPGYLAVSPNRKSEDDENEDDENSARAKMNAALQHQGTIPASFAIREGKSQPPKRYTTGSMILAMENAGNLIEDEELRAQIKGSGIGTSATRAEVLSKLERIHYFQVNKKTQVITPTATGEIIYDILNCAVKEMLSPEHTANWERGLQQIVDGKITKDFYLEKINEYVRYYTGTIKGSDFSAQISQCVDALKEVYPELAKAAASGGTSDVLGECPNCHQPVKVGKFGAYCSNKCGMSFGYAFGKQLDASQVKVLLAGNKVLLKGLKPKDPNKSPYDMYIIPKGIVPYSYTNKNGEQVQGMQFEYDREFPPRKPTKAKSSK